uniref:BY PROTMAP: gi/472583764/gb/EMS21388.1/ cytochrome c oxidase subunit IV [Rhodosporidium toruloides NP11] gi/647402182/emb/CDR48462.1/ RHTO0S18e00584g1_1 [Rhodosporidium toruloides] n=1 Tax=Rhodotorula toruloides TaxID=5286 RepID=A0A0K3CD49_RHOTO
MLRSSALRVVRQAPLSRAASTQVAPIEVSWKNLSPAEQEQTFKHLEELQKKDWKELSLDEKKAAYYVAFGPHGPRAPLEVNTGKTIGGVIAALGAASVLFYLMRKNAQETPKTLSKEWQEESNARLREQQADPFTGLSSKNYQGKGQVTF